MTEKLSWVVQKLTYLGTDFLLNPVRPIVTLWVGVLYLMSRSETVGLVWVPIHIQWKRCKYGHFNWPKHAVCFLTASLYVPCCVEFSHPALINTKLPFQWVYSAFWYDLPLRFGGFFILYLPNLFIKPYECNISRRLYRTKSIPTNQAWWHRN